jgi:hypothetical protein
MENTVRSTSWSAGRIILCFTGLFTLISPYVADWNATHIYNPRWPPHAKFHNAQTMVLGAFMGMLTLYCLLLRKTVKQIQRLNEGCVIVSLYWLSQLVAIFFPGAKLLDQGTNAAFPNIFGIPFNQLTMDIGVILPLIILGYFMEKKRLDQLAAEK